MSFAKLSEKFNGIILSALFLACWNIISLFIEYSLLRSVYNDVPELKKDIIENKKSIFSKMSNLYKGWFVYFKQGIVCLPGISLAALFLTVLSFDSITIAYAKSQDLSESAISIIQGIGIKLILINKTHIPF
jgi:iron-regulated transporter 1